MEVTINDAFHRALEAHRSGNFVTAKAIYETILKKKILIPMQILI